MSTKVQIKVFLTFRGQELEMTRDEAREIFVTLKSLFPEPAPSKWPLNPLVERWAEQWEPPFTVTSTL